MGMALPSPAGDSTALVTGASSGIGSELARGLARRGHGLTLVARREERLKTLADELAQQHGVRTEYITCDLTDEVARRELKSEIAKRNLAVDILVNNAGFSTTGPVAKSDPAREVAMIRTDVETVAHLTSIFLPGM